MNVWLYFKRKEKNEYGGRSYIVKKRDWKCAVGVVTFIITFIYILMER